MPSKKVFRVKCRFSDFYNNFIFWMQMHSTKSTRSFKNSYSSHLVWSSYAKYISEKLNNALPVFFQYCAALHVMELWYQWDDVRWWTIVNISVILQSVCPVCVRAINAVPACSLCSLAPEKVMNTAGWHRAHYISCIQQQRENSSPLTDH